MDEEYKTLVFKGVGSFTVRGLTVGEDIRVREKVRSKKGFVDEDEVAVEQLKLALVKSPEGENPPIVFVKALKLGLAKRLLFEMGKLSNVELEEEKNLETPLEAKK